MTITTQYLSDNEFESTNNIGCSVKVDTRADDLREGQKPTELLLTALSACVAVDIVLMLKKKRKTVIDFKIEVDGKRKETHPRGYTSIHLNYILKSPDAGESDLQKVASLALNKYCSVADTLKAEISASQQIIKST